MKYKEVYTQQEFLIKNLKNFTIILFEWDILF